MLSKNSIEVPLRPKSFEVLHCLIRHRGMLVTKDQLFDEVWPDVVVTPDSINQCIIEIRKALDDAAHEIVRTLPRRGYLFDMQLTEVNGREHDAPQAPRRPYVGKAHLGMSRRVVLAVALALAVVVSVFLLAGPNLRLPGMDAAASHTEPSIVVLPFLGLTAGSDKGYFALGLTEELTQLLQRIPGLRVISRTSAFAFEDSEMPVSDIAERLDVSYVLEGSVRIEGSHLRITAQLIDAHNDEHLWAQSYDRVLQEIFAIQEEIAALVVRDLEVNLSDELPRLQRTKPEVYDLYLQAKVTVFSEEAIRSSINKLKQALKIDPTFSVGWAALGQNYERLAWIFMGYPASKETWELAADAANRAIRLDPYSAPAHTVLGSIGVHQNKLQEAADHFERAIELDPGNTLASDNVVYLLQSLGRFEEALQLGEFRLKRDPLSDGAHMLYATTLLMDRQPARSVEHWQKAMELNPIPPPYVPALLGYALAMDGKAEAALDILENENTWNKAATLAWIYQRLGRSEDYERELAIMKKLEGDTPKRYSARWYAFLGLADLAFERLELIKDFTHWNRERYWPVYWPIEQDPRWEKFLTKAGVSDAQLRQIKFSFSLPSDN